MMPDGIGALAIQLEQLKKKLTAEGLFNPDFQASYPGLFLEKSVSLQVPVVQSFVTLLPLSIVAFR